MTTEPIEPDPVYQFINELYDRCMALETKNKTIETGEKNVVLLRGNRQEKN